MNALLRIATATTLALALGTVACGPKNNAGTLTEEQATDPVANFQSGLMVLQTPTREGTIDYATAYDRFLKAEQLGAGAHASFNAGWAAEQLGRREVAIDHYQRAYDAAPTYEPAVYSLTRLLDEAERYDEALAVAQAYHESDPSNEDAHIAYIDALGKAGQYETAHAEASSILLTDPENEQVYRSLSAMYQRKGDFGMAELLSQKAMSMMEAQDPGVLNNLGVADLVQGDEAAAIEQFKAALELTPNAFEPNINLGFIALNSGDYQLAFDSLTRAVDADPTSLDAQLGLAVANRGLGEFDAADRLYSDIIKSDPSYELAYFNAATLHQKYTRNYNKAIKYLEAYIDEQGPGIAGDNPAFAQMEAVRAAKAEEVRRQEEEAARLRAEEERRRRNEELLSSMSGTITEYQGKFSANSGCLDEGVTMEGEMILEQAQMVVDAQDAGMAADIQMLLEGYIPAWDEAIAGCAGGAAPAPTDEAPAPEEAPAE